MTDGDLLGDHAAERHADHGAGRPADVVEQAGGVVAVLGHRVRRLRHRRLPEAALVVRQQVEPAGERSVEDVRLGAQIAAAAGDEQDRRPLAAALVPDRQLADVGVGQLAALKSSLSRNARSRLWRALRRGSHIDS